MEQITIEELCEKMKEAISGASYLEKFYIGRTDDNLEQRKEKHESEKSLPYTIKIAIGEESLISRAEICLQDIFIDKDLRCVNQRKGGGQKGNILYISFKNKKTQNIDDLYDEEFEWGKVYKLKEK